MRIRGHVVVVVLCGGPLECGYVEVSVVCGGRVE